MYTFPADIYARYLRLKKEDVVFIGGSDEHGVPITLRAKKEGITPQACVRPLSQINKKTRSKSLVFRSIFTAALRAKHIISLHPTSSVSSTMMAN